MPKTRAKPARPLPTKEHFKRSLTKRFFVRFHMSLILLATGLGGMATNRALLWAGLDSMAGRYVLALFGAYAVFLVCIRLWLWYVIGRHQPKPERDRTQLVVDTLDVSLDGIGRSLSYGSGHHHPPAAGAPDIGDATGNAAGGSFFGSDAGAASDSGEAAGGSFFGEGVIAESTGSAGGGNFFDSDADADAGTAAGAVFAGSAPDGPLSTASASGGGGSWLGDFDLGDDAGAIVALIALAAIIAVIFGAGAYLIWAAPDILAEAAFQLALPFILKKQSARMDDPNWVGSVLKATWIPFVVVLLLVGGIGFGLEVAFPGAHTIHDVQHYDTLPGRRSD